MHFTEFALNKPILKAIFEKNYDTPTDVQKETIPLVLAKKDAERVLQIDPELNTHRGKCIKNLLYLFNQDSAVINMRSG